MVCEDITSEVIKIFYKVYNILGYGFLEKVYGNAMMIEFRRAGIKFVNQFPVMVFYKGEVVGDYVADFLVEEKVIVEIKAIRELSLVDENQLLNYLTSTDKEVGLLLNFGEKAEIKRKVYDNGLKKYVRG
jgi:GxxExxY protein